MPRIQRSIAADHPRACGANERFPTETVSEAGSSPRMRGKPVRSRRLRARRRIIPAHAGQTNSVPAKRSSHADHPRACGANPALSVMTAAPAGSSPRMRGKRAGHRLRPRPYRIIPAHAGQTTATRCPCESPADHPRACGANLTADDAHASTAGSSPRMRGKHLFDAFRVRGGRIIPAHAGQTMRCARLGRVMKDHPRACGANLASRRFHHGLSGSSPRMRGKHDRYGHAVAQRRIIPAHAGQTALSSSSLVNATDHPRACGANGGLPMAFSWLTGSSPRMRGKRVEPVCDGAEVRIIPAHAGQTAPNRQDACPCPDHPRACGANRRYGRFSTRPVGSSPRMRGKRPVHHRVHADLRIIPAHAGQTSSSPSICQQRPDHPRACGANQAAGLNAGILGGSSPRMRGKHRVHRVRGRGIRIIPAHAGQTWRADASTTACPDHPRACGANELGG